MFAVVGGRVGPEDVAHGAGLGDFASTLDFLDLLEGDAVVGEEAAVQDQDLRELEFCLGNFYCFFLGNIRG